MLELIYYKKVQMRFDCGVGVVLDTQFLVAACLSVFLIVIMTHLVIVNKD